MSFYWSTIAVPTAASSDWGLLGGTFFYFPGIIGQWNTGPDFTFAQQDLWFSKLSGHPGDPHDFKGVAEAPEDYDILPTDVDILPPETQVDNESWVDVSNQRNDAPGAGWTLVEDGTD